MQIPNKQLPEVFFSEWIQEGTWVYASSPISAKLPGRFKFIVQQEGHQLQCCSWQMDPWKPIKINELCKSNALSTSLSPLSTSQNTLTYIKCTTLHQSLETLPALIGYLITCIRRLVIRWSVLPPFQFSALARLFSVGGLSISCQPATWRASPS